MMNKTFEIIEGGEDNYKAAVDDAKIAIENSHRNLHNNDRYVDNEFLLSVQSKNPLVQLTYYFVNRYQWSQEVQRVLELLENMPYYPPDLICLTCLTIPRKLTL